MAFVKFTAGPLAGQKVQLDDKTVVLGRTKRAGVDLELKDGLVSARHAEMRPEDGAWWLVDLDSSNGTEVNGATIDRRRLVDGDTITIGSATFVFTAGSKSAAPPASAPSAAKSAAKSTPAPKSASAPPPAAKKTPAPQRSVPHKASAEDVALVKEMRERADRIRAEVGKVIVGQQEVLDQVLMCIVANGHALLVGLPGMAKTLMVRTLATVLDLEFKRVQFTPDLMPTDIIGTDVLETNRDTGDKEFRFIKGPIFCNLLLADEINRTPPKTQAALLEAMQEKRVTAGNETFTLDEPFFVLATQNPIEQEGTYPLPEAQLDRFMFNIWVDYPLKHEEEAIVGATTSGTIAEPKAVLTRAEILQLQEVVRKVPVSDHVIKYVIELVRATRPGNDDSPEVTKTYVSTGAGPRAGQFLVMAAKARAILEGRIHVSCNDIRRAAFPVLRHRILTNFSADSEGMTSVDIVKKLIEEVPEPGDDAYAGSK